MYGNTLQTNKTSYNYAEVNKNKQSECSDANTSDTAPCELEYAGNFVGTWSSCVRICTWLEVVVCINSTNECSSFLLNFLLWNLNITSTNEKCRNRKFAFCISEQWPTQIDSLFAMVATFGPKNAGQNQHFTLSAHVDFRAMSCPTLWPQVQDETHIQKQIYSNCKTISLNRANARQKYSQLFAPHSVHVHFKAVQLC